MAETKAAAVKEPLAKKEPSADKEPSANREPSANIEPSANKEPSEKKQPSAKKEPRSYLPAEERRQSIIRAAQEVFSRTNLQGARTRDLAKAAGVNQATLYGHFESKEALFVEAVVQPLVDAMRGMYERASSYENADSREEFFEVARSSVRNHLDSMADIFPLLTSALFSDPKLGKKLYIEHIAPLFRERGRVMENAVKEDIDPEMLALLAFGMFFAVAMDRDFRDGGGDLSEIADQVTRLSTFGFAKDRYR